MTKRMKKLGVTTVFALAILLIVGCIAEDSSDDHQPLLGDIHIHQDFKLYLFGEEFNFSQEEFMSGKGTDQLSPFVHLHDMDGDIIHIHMSTVTLAEFFRTLDMGLTDDCFVLNNGTSYCSNENYVLGVYVNGERIDNAGTHEPEDLERILITYGTTDQEEIVSQLQSVTDKSCIQSGSCPERGEPSDESTCLTTEECIALSDSETNVAIAEKKDIENKPNEEIEHGPDDGHDHEH